MIDAGIYGFQMVGSRPRKMDLDKRRAKTTSMLNHNDIKFGISKNFRTRKNTYLKTFGNDSKFEKILRIPTQEQREFIEDQIRERLKPYRRINEKTGRKIPEWYTGISYEYIKNIILEFKNYPNVMEVKND